MNQLGLVNNKSATDWKSFTHQVRDKDCNLLRKLDVFPNSVLVAGCQRSGTTMVARLITKSDGMVNYWFGRDDELDAAMILSGYVDHEPGGRYCFQTTYVNECYREYFELRSDHRIIWVFRNPYSVAYSMLNNWGTNNPNRVFKTCGVPLLTGIDKWRYKLFGIQGVPMIRRACWGFIGKISQLLEIYRVLGPELVLVMDYDDLVQNKTVLLPFLYQFIDLEYKENYADFIHNKSMNKRKYLSGMERKIVEDLCEPIYQKARALIMGPSFNLAHDKQDSG